MDQKTILQMELEADIAKLREKYRDEIQFYTKTARHIEDTNQCMVTLPCHNKDKKLMILAIQI